MDRMTVEEKNRDAGMLVSGLFFRQVLLTLNLLLISSLTLFEQSE